MVSHPIMAFGGRNCCECHLRKDETGGGARGLLYGPQHLVCMICGLDAIVSLASPVACRLSLVACRLSQGLVIARTLRGRLSSEVRTWLPRHREDGRHYCVPRATQISPCTLPVRSSSSLAPLPCLPRPSLWCLCNGLDGCVYRQILGLAAKRSSSRANAQHARHFSRGSTESWSPLGRHGRFAGSVALGRCHSGGEIPVP